MHWRHVWVIKNRKGQYWRKVAGFTYSFKKCSLYGIEANTIPALKEARKIDFTAYTAKGMMEISELA